MEVIDQSATWQPCLRIKMSKRDLRNVRLECQLEYGHIFIAQKKEFELKLRPRLGGRTSRIRYVLKRCQQSPACYVTYGRTFTAELVIRIKRNSMVSVLKLVFDNLDTHKHA